MNIKYFPLLALSAFAGMDATAQDLSNKIPAQAQFVLTFNNKAIIENSSIELLNETLNKLGAFEHTTKDINYPVENLMQWDFNLDKQAYVYRSNTDSLHYIGILIPLKENHKIKEHMFSQFDELPIYNGYERRISKDGKTQTAWNKETLFILTGDVHNSYFQMQEVADRYGLDLERYGESEWIYDESLAEEADDVVDSIIEVDAADWDTSEQEVFADTAIAVAAEEFHTDSVDISSSNTWEYDVDTVYADEYDYETDSLYLLNQQREAKNDSLKNRLFVNWLAADFNDYLDPKHNMGKNKAIKLTDQKHLLRFWIPNLDELYQDMLPYDIFQMAYGFDMKDLKYGYQDATFDLIQDQHTLRVKGSIGVDDKMTKVFKSLYKNKVNKKFTKYIPENHLAYASASISTEGYLQQLPTIISRWYVPIAGDYEDVLTIAATAIEIGLDEKAIGKVAKGDNVFFLNDLHKVEKEYITYEYDDDYNEKEVTKTKDEYVPNFLWMFTSEDQRIFKKALEFAVKKQEVTVEKDIYKINESKVMEPIYILFKNDMVFVGSDIEQLTAINENRFKGSRNAQVKKDLVTNPFNFVVHMSALPEVIKQLEIPVTPTWDKTLQDLAGYGDLQIKSSKLNKNRFSGEISIELPKENKNALQYILKHVIENLKNNNTN